MDVKYLAQMHGDNRKSRLSIATYRATRWVLVQLQSNNTATSPQAFLDALHKACPMKLHEPLTDNGKELTDRLFASRERDPLTPIEARTSYLNPRFNRRQVLTT